MRLNVVHRDALGPLIRNSVPQVSLGMLRTKTPARIGCTIAQSHSINAYVVVIRKQENACELRNGWISRVLNRLPNLRNIPGKSSRDTFLVICQLRFPFADLFSWPPM